MAMLSRLRLLTAGESHGPGLTGILDGVPAGIPLTEEDFALQLRRRRGGHGRSPRQKLERDAVQLQGGVRYGRTTGAPVTLFLPHAEAARWADTLSPWPIETPVARRTVPRPGHADRAGMVKHDLDDVRDVLERASARETAMRVALSVVCRALLRAVDIEVASTVVQIGDVRAPAPLVSDGASLAALRERVETSVVRCHDDEAGARMVEAIDVAAAGGDTLGGAFVVLATGVPIGLGSYTQWDRRLSARLGGALLSIHSAKSVSLGEGAALASTPGSRAHDTFVVDDGGARRVSNHAGGLEGGMTNGAPVTAEVALKPLSTLPGGLPSVDVDTGVAARGLVERSDVCAVPAGGVVGEAMMCLVLADALLDSLGGDSLAQVQAHLAAGKRRP
jgi:chorismate synthase